MGIFTSLDPFEGMSGRPMSLNGYSWVEGNTPNMADPSGAILETPNRWNLCAPQLQTGRNCSCYDDTNANVPIPYAGQALYVTARQVCELGGFIAYPECSSSGGFEISLGGTAPGVLTFNRQCVLGSDDPEDRKACAVAAYNSALSRLGGSMTWDEFIALRCEPGTCQDVRDVFERAVIRRLSDACGGSSSCDADGFITYIGEKQVWYNAGRPSGQADPQDLERLFGNGSYMEHLDAFGRWWSDSSSAVQEGCQGFSCSWGNCRLDLRSGQYNYPESLRWIYYRDEASDFYVREPFPSPGDVIFIVGGYEP